MALSGQTVPTHPVQGPRCYLCTKKDQRRILRKCRREGKGDCEGGDGCPNTQELLFCHSDSVLYKRPRKLRKARRGARPYISRYYIQAKKRALK